MNLIIFPDAGVNIQGHRKLFSMPFSTITVESEILNNLPKKNTTTTTQTKLKNKIQSKKKIRRIKVKVKSNKYL